MGKTTHLTGAGSAGGDGGAPLRQSPVNMSWDDWHELLDRYLDGEPIRDLAAEYGVSPSSIHRNARKFGKRKKDRKRAVWLAKGPAPVVVTRDGRRLTVVCAELAFDFDPDDPAATERSILARFGDAAVTGAEQYGAKLGRMTLMVRRILSGGPLFGAAAAANDNEPPGPPVRLRPAQTPPGLLPDGSDWSTWLFLGGRGAGKTLAGASWLADQAERLGAGGRLALVGPTLHDVREVMIEGPSGIRSLPRWTRATRPVYEPSRRRLVFANGCIAQAFSAEDPDSLRGPQFSAAWADEFCAWPAVGARGAGETLALLRMGLRLAFPGAAVVGPSGPPDPTRPGASRTPGAQAASDRVASDSAPKLVVTTTPRPTRALISLRDEPSCALTHAGTADNVAHLSPGFLDELRSLYGGTRREAQEIEGLIVDLAGALFTAEMMVLARRPSPLGGEGGPE
ncbi:MAG: terminase family protein, partial [Brevundimonas sp.]|nr:terminase family protein [Brevundimonas sp.]